MNRLERFGLALTLLGLAGLVDDAAGVWRLLSGMACGVGLVALVDPFRR